MITRFKIFENVKNGYMLGKDLFFINDVMKYLKVDTFVMDQSMPESPYVDNIMNFFKEIFMNKKIIFKSVDKPFSHTTIKGTVKKIGRFSYKDEFYIKVKLKDTQTKTDRIFLDYENKDEWFLIQNNCIISIYDYDADTKPLHKEVEFKKEAEKYNL